MKVEEILALYDREQRIEVEYPETRKEILPEVVRFVGQKNLPGLNFILYSDLDEHNAGEVIAAQVAFYSSLGHSFEWKVYEHDRPADLAQRLQRHGFEVEHRDAIMALDLQEAPAALLAPVEADVRRLTDPEQIGVLINLLNQVWPEPQDWLANFLAADLRERPDYGSIYLAYVDETPACAAWVNFHEGSHFASLWGGSTLPQYRRRGLYQALLATRVQEAIARGYRFLTIDASPMSQPIVQKHGFRLLTYAQACNWNFQSQEE